jgi:hypothetical protein
MSLKIPATPLGIDLGTVRLVPQREWPRGFQEFKVPRFHDIRHVKVVRLSSLTHQPFLTPGMFLVLIFTRGLVDPRAMEQYE